MILRSGINLESVPERDRPRYYSARKCDLKTRLEDGASVMLLLKSPKNWWRLIS